MFKKMLLCLTLMLASVEPSLAELENNELSGDIWAANQSQAAIKSVVCSPQHFGGAGRSCSLPRVRVIGEWACVTWVSGEAGGMSILRRSGKTWKHITGGGGAMIVSNGIEAGVPQDIAEFLIPIEAWDDPNELKNLSAWELLVIRNMVYARHGRSFSNKRLQDYFNTWGWYEPNPSYSDAWLTPQDKKVIDTVTKVEKAKGYLK